MNKTESQDLDTTPALVPLEARLPTEAPTSVNVGQKPQGNPDSNDQEPSLDPEHEKEDESKPFTDLGLSTISNSSDQEEDESPRKTRDILQVNEKASGKKTSDQANNCSDKYTPNDEDAAPGTSSHYKGRKSPDSYVTISILRGIMLGILSCIGLLVFLNTLVPTIVCQESWARPLNSQSSEEHSTKNHNGD